MYREYPNLPLIEERFHNCIKDALAEKEEQVIAKAKEEGRFPIFRPDFVVEVFLQDFPNTAGLFSKPGSMSGQAITSKYVTVIREINTDIYGVFQDNLLVYIVIHPGKVFKNDVCRHAMYSLASAKSYYGEISQGTVIYPEEL